MLRVKGVISNKGLIYQERRAILKENKKSFFFENLVSFKRKENKLVIV